MVLLVFYTADHDDQTCLDYGILMHVLIRITQKRRMFFFKFAGTLVYQGNKQNNFL